jgi:hypothetical protein
MDSKLSRRDLIKSTAVSASLPLCHVFSAGDCPAGFHKYCRAFQHLSSTVPGRGSSGVHESGLGHFDPQTLSLRKEQMVVDNAFEHHRDVMAEIIRRARERSAR